MLVLLEGLCQKGLDLEESCSLFLQEQEHMICFEKDGKDHKGTIPTVQAPYPNNQEASDREKRLLQHSVQRGNKGRWTVDRIMNGCSVADPDLGSSAF